MNLGVKRKAILAPIVGMAVNITHAKQDFLSDLYLAAVERKTARITDDKKRHLFAVPKTKSGRRCKCQLPERMCIFNFQVSVVNSRAAGPVGLQSSTLLTL